MFVATQNFKCRSIPNTCGYHLNLRLSRGASAVPAMPFCRQRPMGKCLQGGGQEGLHKDSQANGPSNAPQCSGTSVPSDGWVTVNDFW